LTRARKVRLNCANHEIIAFVDNDVFIAETGNILGEIEIG